MQNRMWNSCLDFINKEIWRLNSHWITTSIKNIQGQSQVPSKREDNAERKEMLQIIV